MQNNEYWQGYNDALKLLSTKVDRLIKTAYNDHRMNDSLLDVKVEIRELRKIVADDCTELATIL